MDITTAKDILLYGKDYQKTFLPKGCRFQLSRITPVKGRRMTTRLRGCEGR